MKSALDIIKESKAKVQLPKFTRARDQQSSVMFMALMTASNMHLTLAEMYHAAGDETKNTFHQDLANRLRNEANGQKNKG